MRKENKKVKLLQPLAEVKEKKKRKHKERIN